MYAKMTKVPVFRSQAEIRKILSGAGATAFAFAENNNMAMVQFEMSGKRIRFLMPLPTNEKNVEQLCRAKWRALVLTIKAKLEAVKSNITTLEQEFMAHIMLPNGQSVGDVVLPEIENSYQSKEMPPLLGMR